MPCRRLSLASIGPTDYLAACEHCGVTLDAASGGRGKDRVARANAEAGARNHQAAWAVLRDAIKPEDSFIDQSRVARCLRAIDLGRLGLRPLRLALVASRSHD